MGLGGGGGGGGGSSSGGDDLPSVYPIFTMCYVLHSESMIGKESFCHLFQCAKPTRRLACAPYIILDKPLIGHTLRDTRVIKNRIECHVHIVHKSSIDGIQMEVCVKVVEDIQIGYISHGIGGK